ncbi:MAG: hypothetical protein JXN60_01435 [Lentisphaerae bacterium]|nr:hypothetical protein [Lentisphaerota bacterium]
MQPRCQIVLLGDEKGVAEVAAEFGVAHIPDIDRTPYGTPLVSEIFSKTYNLFPAARMCYVNGDIILRQDLIQATRQLQHKRFVLVARRTNITLSEEVNITGGNYPSGLLGGMELDSECAIDMFLFTPHKALINLPDFSVGRPAWDNWFLYNAWLHKFMVIDATNIVSVLHQRHDYNHVPAARGNGYEGPEGDANRILAGGSWDTLFSLMDCTHVFDERGLRVARDRAHVEHRVDRMSRLRPGFYKVLGSWKLRTLACWLNPWV